MDMKRNKLDNIKHLKAIVIIFNLSLTPILAQTSELAYSWKECLDLAIKNNPELSAALSKVQSSEYSKKAQRANFLPSVSASVGRTKATTQINNTNTTNDGYSASLNASLNVFNGLRDYNLLSQAQATIEVSKAQYVKKSADILYSLKSAYQNYRFAIENTQLAQKILDRRKENLKLVNLRFEGGLENKGSELLSEAYLSKAQYDLLVAKQSQMTALSSLAQVMGLDTDTKFLIKGDLELKSPPSQSADLDFEVLARSTPTYIESLSQEKYYKKSISVAKSGFSPTLNLTGSLSQNGDQILADDREGSSIGVSLNIPIFDGGSDYYGVQSASANYAQQRSTRIHTERSVAVELRNKYVEFIQAVALLKTNTVFQDAAQVRAQIARGKYNNGLLTFEDWVLIENDLISRQKAYLTSHLNRVLAEASWYQVLGKGIAQ